MGGKLNAGIDFLEFRSSEIAASVAMSVSGEIQAKDIDKAMPCFSKQVEKVKDFVRCPHDIKFLILVPYPGFDLVGKAQPPAFV